MYYTDDSEELVEDLPKPNKVRDKIYIGCYQCASNLPALKSLGISHVLNVMGGAELFPQVWFTYTIQHSSSKEFHLHDIESGFGCWLSGVDINTQQVISSSSFEVLMNFTQSFEALNQRAVAVVVDPIQSVKGKVVVDAFRLINPQTMMMGQEPRQTTSNLGHLNKPSIQALIHGLNRHYYSIAINYRKNELEQKMLLNLHKKKWTEPLHLENFESHETTNEKLVQVILESCDSTTDSVKPGRKCWSLRRITTKQSRKKRNLPKRSWRLSMLES